MERSTIEEDLGEGVEDSIQNGNALKGAGEWAGTEAQDKLVPLSETGMARSNH